jgi:hypothetical protein
MGSTPGQAAPDGAEVFSLVLKQVIRAIAAAAG